MSHLMRLRQFSSSVNSFFKRTCTASQWARRLIFGWTLLLLPYFMCATSEGSGETALVAYEAALVAYVISTTKRFETTETFGLSQFSSCFSPFQFFPFIIHCFSVSKHQKWGLVFSPFPELVSVLFRNISIFSLYNPLFQCFETPEMGPGILTFFQLVSILFPNVSKQLKRLDLVNFLPVSVRFSFFPI